jgi:hypothetical protein
MCPNRSHSRVLCQQFSQNHGRGLFYCIAHHDICFVPHHVIVLNLESLVIVITPYILLASSVSGFDTGCKCRQLVQVLAHTQCSAPAHSPRKSQYRTRVSGQLISPVDGFATWFQLLCKFASQRRPVLQASIRRQGLVDNAHSSATPLSNEQRDQT